MEGLEKLSTILNKPLNKLVNEAVREYVTRRILETEVELASTLDELRAYRKSDPDFDRSIAEFINAEVSTAHDPAEGHVVPEVGPTQEKVLKLLNG
jgi:hypothetical protein